VSDVREMISRDLVPPDASELISRAESLVPLLRKNATRAEELRRLPDESVRALEEAGLFQMTRPVRHGGYGTDAATVAQVMTLIASGCPATTWVMMIYTSVGDLAEMLSDEALAEIYADPHPRIAGVFGKTGAVLQKVDGGFRVRGQGRWPFNSGCHHATWDLLRVMVEEPDGASWPAFAAVPMSDLTICDDWHVMGALGTGSNTVTCGELFIPDRRVTPFAKHPRSVIRMDLSAAHSVTLALGMTRYALEAFLAVAKAHGISNLGYDRMIDAPVVHAAVGTAAVNIKMIEAYQQWVLSALDPVTATLKPADAAIFGAGSARCLQLAREAIEGLYALCPSADIRLESPIQRLVRDVHVFEHQPGITPFINLELYGRNLCAL
jgi:3-hydroxy-9,10-secoandrosta-1,3,5(10)-triene-9,17-dione monooxygenase